MDIFKGIRKQSVLSTKFLALSTIWAHILHMFLSTTNTLTSGYRSVSLFYIMYFSYSYLHNFHLTTFTLFNHYLVLNLLVPGKLNNKGLYPPYLNIAGNLFVSVL
jgi:hypothetical protein